MKKLLSVFALLLLVITINSGCSKHLTREDFYQLSDKNFYINDVIVGHISQKGTIVSGIGIKKENVKKEALLALPVEEMSKILSDELKIQVDISDYKKANLEVLKSRKAIFSKYDQYDNILLWESEKSGKENINNITFRLLLWEKQTSGLGFTVFLGMAAIIEIKTAEGDTKDFKIWLPDQSKYDPEIMSKEQGVIVYNVEKMAKAQNQSVEEMTKFIILEELKKLPALLKDKISKVE
ncbi:MAG: hypothetical protein WDA74_11315 [Spirochaetota bacterium]